MSASSWTRLRSTTATVYRRLADLVQPPACVACQVAIPDVHDDLWLCEPCRDAFAPVDIHRCARCGMQVGIPLAMGERCIRCQALTLHFDGVTVLGPYDERLREAVLRMKRWTGESLAIAIGRLLAARHAAEWQSREIDAVVPVPMHWSRRLWRATNSPDLIASQVARRLGVPCEDKVVVRTRRTEYQSRIVASSRHSNVRGAFRLRWRIRAEGLRVLVIDDVLTTGATTSEVARTLKQAGAAAVYVGVVARAAGHA